MKKPMSAEHRAAASERMKGLNERMRTDPTLKAKAVAGATEARRSPAYRAIQSLVMTETMSRPENREKARLHCVDINRDADVRARQWATRKSKSPPKTPKRSKRPKRKLVSAGAIDRDAVMLKLLAREARRSPGNPS